jgi:hypothetical protein
LELSKYYAVNYKAALLYYISRLFKSNQKKIHLNFLITSKAELRVFKPIILSVIDNSEIIANIFYLGNCQFDNIIQSKISQSNNISVATNIYPVIESFHSANYLNLICLDHSLFYRQHSVGVDLIKYIRLNKGKTICFQHGGTQIDNINGHKTSESQYQVVFGKYVYNNLI